MHRFTPLCLILCWMLPVSAKKVHISTFPVQDDKQPIELSMVENAVDDMYNGCDQTMEDMVKNKYFMEENNKAFAKLWRRANNCAEDRLKNKEKEDNRLTKNHMQAICLYTSDFKFEKGTHFYQRFNSEVRTMREKYDTKFKFKSLHFWLTSAIQILNNEKKCNTTVRRTGDVFTGKVNQIIRFGFFASSSFIHEMTRFGNKTCFQIKTCSGAFLKNYSHLKSAEKEVLIPPYEMFKIIKIIKKKEEKDEIGLSDCEKVFILESAGIQSNLNCHAVK